MPLPPLYKYLDVQGAKLTLGNRTFKFAKPSDFNDVEDLTVQSMFPEELEAALTRLARSFTDVILRNLDRPPVCEEPNRTKIMMLQQVFRTNPEAVELSKRHGRDQQAHDVEGFRTRADALLAELNRSLQTWRVFCATTDIASELMWEQYAQNHQGIALRIVPSRSKDSKFQLFRAVEYFEKRPPLYKDSLDFSEGHFFVDPVTQTNAMLERIIYSKTLQWKHEKEYRLAIPLRQGEDWNTLAYHPEEIAELYLGSAMTAEVREDVIRRAKVINPNIGIIQMFRGANEALTFQKVS